MIFNPLKVLRDYLPKELRSVPTRITADRGPGIGHTLYLDVMWDDEQVDLITMQVPYINAEIDPYEALAKRVVKAWKVRKGEDDE